MLGALVAAEFGLHRMCASWGRAEIDALLESKNPSRAFGAIEDRIGEAAAADRQSLRECVIEALEEAFARATRRADDWLRAILEASPNYLRAAPSNELRLCALLVGLLKEAAPSERGELILPVIVGLSDISLLCALFCAVDGDWTNERAAAESGEAFFGAHAGAARNALCDRVVDLAATGKLWLQASPSAIVWFWFACGQEQQVYVFVKQSMREASSLARLLEMPIDRVASSEGDRDLIAVRRWSKIIDFNTLEQCAVALVLSAASKPDKRSARRFLDAYAAGKSELFK